MKHTVTLKLNRTRRLLFVAKHPGFIRRVAEEAGVDESLVSRLFHGHLSKAHRSGSRTQQARAILERELERLLKEDQAA